MSKQQEWERLYRPHWFDLQLMRCVHCGMSRTRVFQGDSIPQCPNELSLSAFAAMRIIDRPRHLRPYEFR